MSAQAKGGPHRLQYWKRHGPPFVYAAGCLAFGRSEGGSRQTSAEVGSVGFDEPADLCQLSRQRISIIKGA